MEKISNAQDLIINAYTTDKHIWDKSIGWIKSEINGKLQELRNITIDIATEPKATKLWYKLIKRPSPNEVKLLLVRKDLDELEGKLKALQKQEPNPDFYELALLGGNIFKAV